MQQDITVRNFYGDWVDLKSLKFLFLFCPNNSGTTVLSQYLLSQIGGYLPPFGNNEGQMAPAVRHIMRQSPSALNWQESQRFDWRFIRGEWEALAAGKMFIEASPPNLMRVPDIKTVFGEDSSALISICNPYQYIASCLRRYNKRPEAAAQTWLKRAGKIIEIRQAYPFFPFISYEEFTSNPRAVNDRLGLPFKEAVIRGKKGSGLTGIKSGYCRGIGFLKPEEAEVATECLAKVPEIMGHFGYALMSGPDLLAAAQARDPEEFALGLSTREGWAQDMPARSRRPRARSKG